MMWALLLLILLPDGRALAQSEINVFPTQDLCLRAAPDWMAGVKEQAAAKIGVPPELLRPIATCAHVAGTDV